MAKKKKPDDSSIDDSPLEVDVDEMLEADVEAEVDADVEEAVEDVEEPVEEAVEEADAAVVEEAVEEAIKEEEPEPRPKAATSTLNLVLFVLNFVVAVGVVYLVILDYAKRHALAHAVFRHDVALQGTPLDDSDSKAAAKEESGWAQVLEPEWLKDAAGRRGWRGSEPFQPAHEIASRRINPADLGDDTLKDIFRELNAGKEVKYQRDELKSLSGKLPSAIEAAAAKVAEKAGNEVAKRNKLRELLMPLAVTTKQVEALDSAIGAAAVNQLDAALVDAATRRLYADILLPMEIFRSPDLKNLADEKKRGPFDTLVQVPEKAPSLKSFIVSLDMLKEMLTKRIDDVASDKDEAGKRDSVERRREIAFFLLHLSQVKDPNGEALYARDRVEALVGLQQFIQAADTYAVVLRIVAQRHQTAVARDRGYYTRPLEQRLYDQNIDSFIDGLVRVMTGGKVEKFGLEIPIANDKQFRDQLLQALTALPPDKRTGPEVLKQVKTIMTKQGIAIVEHERDKGFRVKELAFEREVIRLLDSREPGFIGAHIELIARIKDLVAQIKDHDNQLRTLAGQETQRLEHLKERQTHAKVTVDKLIAARAKTKMLADELREVQEQLFRAQVELSDVDLRNQNLERRLRVLENKRGGPRP